MRCVVIESPFAGDVEKNLEYLRACMKDCLMRGEAPYASHALYTQPGVLDDDKPEERTLGMEAGFEIGRRMDATVVYKDRGISGGMEAGMLRASEEGRPVEIRSLSDWRKTGNYIKRPKLLTREQVIEKLYNADKNPDRFFNYIKAMARSPEHDGKYEEEIVNRYISK